MFRAEFEVCVQPINAIVGIGRELDLSPRPKISFKLMVNALTSLL